MKLTHPYDIKEGSEEYRLRDAELSRMMEEATPQERLRLMERAHPFEDPAAASITKGWGYESPMPSPWFIGAGLLVILVLNILKECGII